MEGTVMMAEATTEFMATLEEISRERGLTLEETCERSVSTGEARRLTPQILEAGGFYGLGNVLDGVLDFTEERGRLGRGWAQSFLSRSPE
jgi:hypothetical protein